MISLVAAGYACPAFSLNDEDLKSLFGKAWDGHVPSAGAIEARRSVLVPEYLFGTQNLDIFEGLKNVTATPSQLGADAVRDALNRSGAQVEDISLLLADTVTPFETCPAEAPRIGALLGYKGPAYDIIGGSGAFPLFVETVRAQRNLANDRVVGKGLIVCVSTNTPTPFINYNGGVESLVFGDAAGAVLLRDSKEPGTDIAPFEIVDAYSFRSRKGPFVAQVEAECGVYEPLRCVERGNPTPLPPPSVVSQFLLQWNAVASKRRLLISEPGLAASWEVPSDATVCEVSDIGRNFGSQALVGLASHWERCLDADYVGVLCGDGTDGSFGYVLLQRVAS